MELARLGAAWTLRDARTGKPLMRRHNLFTDAGLTNLAALWGGAGSPSLYLVLSNFKVTLVDNPLLAGATSAKLSAKVDQAGDTQIVLDVGGANQETVAFTAVNNNGDGTFTYSLAAPTTLDHSAGVWCDRLPKQTDTMSVVQNEVQYDSVAAPNARMKATPPGYSTGTGLYTMQFFLTGNQAVTQWVSLGLSSTGVVGGGSLMNHLLFGYDHLQGNDVELDVTLTTANG